MDSMNNIVPGREALSLVRIELCAQSELAEQGMRGQGRKQSVPEDRPSDTRASSGRVATCCSFVILSRLRNGGVIV